MGPIQPLRAAPRERRGWASEQADVELGSLRNGARRSIIGQVFDDELIRSAFVHALALIVFYSVLPILFGVPLQSRDGARPAGMTSRGRREAKHCWG
jgi:hypothetical protein